MTQPAVGGSSSTTTTNLQLHHNFRWVLCANHTEPTRGFLGRYLRRRLVEQEITSGGTRSADLVRIVDWLPKVWQHLNRFLETHSSSDVTIGPRLFLSCPMDPNDAQVWFTDLWNYSVVPYLLEAVREGLQTYGHRAAWEDPVDWVIENYPWSRADWTSLHHLRHEDVGYDPQVAGAAVVGIATSSTGMNKQVPVTGGPAQTDAELKDPMMNMLLRLQEAASYSSPQSNESDSATSVDGRDSNATASSSALAETQKASSATSTTETDSRK